MKNGVNVEERDSEMATPLMHAACNDRLDCVRALIVDYGASTNATNKYGSTVLSLACQEGHLQCIHELMKNGANVEARDNEMATPLMHAALNDMTDCVRTLIVDYGASTSATNISGCTALFLAMFKQRDDAVAVKNHVACVRTLIDEGNARMNATDDEGGTFLHIAAAAGNVHVTAMASCAQYDVNFRNNIGRTALHVACEKGHVECVHELMKHGANLEEMDDANGATPLKIAAVFNHRDCVKTLIDTYGASINARDKQDYTALHACAYIGHVDIVRLLLSYRQCEVNRQGFQDKTALHEASRNGQVACVHELMKAGADVEACSRWGTPLVIAALHDQTDCVLTLLNDYHASVNATDNVINQFTALHYAASNGNLSLINTLARNRDLNVRNRQGWTPLKLARRSGHVSCIKALIYLEISTAIKVALRRQTSPLHLAAEYGYSEHVATLFMECGADVNAVDKRRDTPLHRAAYTGHVDVIKTLVSYSYDPPCRVNLTGQQGRTALRHACEAGHTTCIHELMALGASINARDASGGTPLHLAAEYNHPGCLEAIIKIYGASINARDSYGDTALHRAARRKQVVWSGNARTAAIKALLSEPQCDTTITNRLGDTAADIEHKLGHDDIINPSTTNPK